MNSFSRRVQIALASLICIGWVTQTSHAQVNYFWNNPSGGAFNDAGNWNSPFPGTSPAFASRAIFDLPNAYTVTFTADPPGGTIASARRGNVTFDLQGHHYFLGDMFVSEFADNIAELTVVDGTLNPGTTVIGEADPSSGTVVVGEGGRFFPNIFRIGNHGTGSLLIQDGGRVTAAATRVGNELSGNGTIQVSGTDGSGNRSTFSDSGHIFIGTQGHGEMHITGGGLVESDPDQTTGFEQEDVIALFPAPGGGLGATGTVIVDGTASDGTPSTWNSTGPLAIGNLSGPAYAQGTMTITAGGQVQHTAARLLGSNELPSRVEIHGTDSADNPSKWKLTTGSLDLVGEVLVDDGGRLDTAGGVGLGTFEDSIGRLTISGASENGIRSSYHGVGFTVGGHGIGELMVTEGALVTTPASSGAITIGARSTSRGAVLISGKDAVGNASMMILGRNITVGDEGSASLTIADGGVLFTGFDDPLSFGFVGLRDVADPANVLLTGEGTRWSHSRNLYVGGSAAGVGGFANMTVDDQATIDIGLTLKVWNTSELNINGGTVNADVLELTAGSELQFGIGGLQPGSEHGQVLLSDDALLDGNLQIALLDSFLPTSTDTFTLLDAIDVQGVFENVASGSRLLTQDLSGSFQVDYGFGSPFGPGKIMLSDFANNTLTADVDGDFDVDGADFLAIQRSDPSQISDWQSQFGAAPSLAVSRATPIPEPSTWAMLLLGAAALLRRPRWGVFALLAMILFAAPTSAACAATRTWDGSADIFWNNPFNWTPGLVPGDGDDAVIGGASNNQVRLNGDSFASPVDSVILNPGSGAKLITNGFRLKVHEEGTSTVGGRVRIENGTAVVVHDVIADDSLPGLEAEIVRVGLGGALNNLGFTVVEKLLDIVGGTVAGTGLIELGESGNVGLVNDGTISVGTLGAGDLTLRAEGDALLDLDGVVESGVVLATADNFLGTVGAATLRVVGPLFDEFSGRMEIGQRDSILFSEPWTLDGSLRFLGGHGEDLATLVSPELTVNGSATIAVESGQANIATPLVMNGGTFTVARGTTVDFNGPATFGTGVTFAMGDRDITVNVTRDVHIQQPTVDLDGGVIGSNVVWNVSSGRLLQIEGDHPEVFSATINMNSDSTLTLNGDFFFGSDATLGMTTSGATLNVGGFTRIVADVDLEGSGPFNTVNVAASGTLILNGNIADNPGNVFHGSFVNRGTLGIDGPGSSWTLGNGGSLELRNEGSAPDVQGDLIQNQGVISGDGRFVANVENQLNGRIEPGIGEDTGRLEWEDANLTLQTGSTVAFDIGGRAIGITHDRIDAQLVTINGGELEVGLINDFLPASADVFRILDAITLNGSFGNIASGERLATTDGLGTFLVNYGADSAFADFQIVLSDFQAIALAADLDADFDVDGADFLAIQRSNPALIPTWESQYGAAPSLAVSRATPIPEPSTRAMLLLVAVALLGRRNGNQLSTPRQPVAVLAGLLVLLLGTPRTTTEALHEWTGLSSTSHNFRSSF